MHKYLKQNKICNKFYLSTIINTCVSSYIIGEVISLENNTYKKSVTFYSSYYYVKYTLAHFNTKYFIAATENTVLISAAVVVYEK